jgi:hypothetical protein
MVAPIASSTKKKSCCWLGHCCWLKIVFGLFVVTAAAGLYWKHIRMEREISALSNQLKKGTPAQLQTQLNTIDLLVNMANVHLKTFGDKNSALSYLSQAKKQVQMLPETPEQSALQQALSDDTQTITTVEIMPLETVSKKLDALIEQARGIEIARIAADKTSPLLPADQGQETKSATQVAGAQSQTAASPTPVPSQSKDWQEKLHEGWGHIKDLVKSEDKGASDNPVEAWLVPAKLSMQLEEIKLAAFYRNNDFFQKLINQTLNWLGNHYDLAKNEKVLTLKNELEAMKGWVLAPDAAVLSKSTTALDSLQKRSTTP